MSWYIYIYSRILKRESLDLIMYFEVPYHCIVIYTIFLRRSSCTNVMKIHNYILFYSINDRVVSLTSYISRICELVAASAIIKISFKITTCIEWVCYYLICLFHVFNFSIDQIISTIFYGMNQMQPIIC